MSNDSFTIRFYLNKAKRKGDKFKIYTRIIVNRKKAEFATQLEIEELLWKSVEIPFQVLIGY